MYIWNRWHPLVIAAFIVPLCYSNLTGDTSMPTKMFVLSIFTLLAAWDVRVRFTGIDIIPGLLLMLALIHWHGDARGTLYLAHMVIGVCIYFIAKGMDFEQYELWIYALVLSAIPISLLTIYEYLTGNILAHSPQPPAATFSVRNHLGTYLAVIVPMTYRLYLHGHNWAIHVATLSMIALIYSRTRSAWLAACICLIVVFACTRRYFMRIKPIPFIISTAFILAFALCPPARNMQRQASITSTAVSIVQVEDAGRFSVWRETFRLIVAQPLGSGLGTWEKRFVREGNELIYHPHNDYLWLATELGIPAAMLWIYLLAFSMWRTRSSPLLYISILAIAIDSCFNFPLTRPMGIFIIWASIGRASRYSSL